MMKIRLFALFLSVVTVHTSSQAHARANDGSYDFTCDFMLMTQQNPVKFSVPSPVKVTFDLDKKKLSNIRVIDKGGILYPGSNFKIVERTVDGKKVISMEAAENPAERPGKWSGKRKNDKFHFSLIDDDEKVVDFVLTTEPKTDASEHVVIWNASHTPLGLPSKLRGTGTGYCKLTEFKKATQ